MATKKKTPKKRAEFIPKPYWHIHHLQLVEFTTEPIQERIRFIKDEKDLSEQPLRLKLLKPVKGKLPAEVVAAHKLWWDIRARRGSLDHSWAAEDNAEAALNNSFVTHAAAIERLHAKECKNCPWGYDSESDHKTIFTRKKWY